MLNPPVFIYILVRPYKLSHGLLLWTDCLWCVGLILWCACNLSLPLQVAAPCHMPLSVSLHCRKALYLYKILILPVGVLKFQEIRNNINIPADQSDFVIMLEFNTNIHSLRQGPTLCCIGYPWLQLQQHLCRLHWHSVESQYCPHFTLVPLLHLIIIVASVVSITLQALLGVCYGI